MQRFLVLLALQWKILGHPSGAGGPPELHSVILRGPVVPEIAAESAVSKTVSPSGCLASRLIALSTMLSLWPLLKTFQDSPDLIIIS